MKYIKRGRFSLRTEYAFYIIGTFCIVALLLPLSYGPNKPSYKYLQFFQDPQYLWVLKISFLAWTITSFYVAFIILKQYFIINNNPIAKVDSAAQGYTALEGIQACLSGEPLKSPISDAPCTWYSYIVEEYKARSLGRSKRWTEIENGESNNHFTLTDVTGQCIVYPEDADIFPNVVKVSYDTSWRLFSKYRYTEQLLLPNTHVYVIGVFRTIFAVANVQAPDRQEQHQEVLNMLKSWKKDYKNLLEKFDTNKDGTISAEEWEKAVKYAEEQIAQKYQKNYSEQTSSVNIISKEGLMLNQPFLISALRKKDVVNKFYFKFICYISLFIILTIITFTLDRWYPPMLYFAKLIIK